jgi:hypothetical protein
MIGKQFTISTALEPGLVTLVVFTLQETQFHHFSHEEARGLATWLRIAAKEAAAKEAAAKDQASIDLNRE